MSLLCQHVHRRELPMVFNPYSAGTDFSRQNLRRQNLTSADVRF